MSVHLRAPKPPHASLSVIGAGQSFDLVIVGAGSAGSVVAARASEDPNRSVLLLEAGPDYPDLTQLPFDLLNGHVPSDREHDWGLRHEPTHGRTLPFPRGRVVGGSSAVNAAIALRGVPEDYDDWARLGNAGRSFDEVLPALRRLERDLDFGGEPHHGDAGPISIRRHPSDELLPLHAAFLAAAEQQGYPYCADANAPWDWGAGPLPMNRLGRARISCAIGYLAPARIRPNLTIQADTLVRRVLIERGRAVGVEVESTAGQVQHIGAKLVVLCSGAVMSPAILMRSGIGHRARLEAHGLDVVADAPSVGQNLQDQPVLSMVCVAKDPRSVRLDVPLLQTVLRYTAPDSDKRNDLRIEPRSFVGSSTRPARFGLVATLARAYGSGELRLRSADPRITPIVEQRFCDDKRDATRLAQAFRDVLRLMQAAPLADLIAEVSVPELKRSLDPTQLEAHCRKLAGSSFHPCGTVRMGPREDPASVVDARGRCHSVDNLVVADASILPTVPRAPTQLTAILVGEQIGEWLRTRPGTYGL